MSEEIYIEPMDELSAEERITLQKQLGRLHEFDLEYVIRVAYSVMRARCNQPGQLVTSPLYADEPTCLAIIRCRDADAARKIIRVSQALTNE